MKNGKLAGQVALVTGAWKGIALSAGQTSYKSELRALNNERENNKK